MPVSILVVDDDPEVLSRMKRILAGESTDILTAQTGAEALDIARQTRPDLVILDVRLPDLDGIEVLRRLRTIDAGVPVIIATAYGAAEAVLTCMRLGAFDYLTKPCAKEEIRQLVREALASRTGGTLPSKA